MRLILAERAPIALAVSRQVAVMVATSLIIARACGGVGKREKLRRGFQQIERAGALVEMDVRRQAPEPSDRSERV